MAADALLCCPCSRPASVVVGAAGGCVDGPAVCWTPRSPRPLTGVGAELATSPALPPLPTARHRWPGASLETGRPNDPRTRAHHQTAQREPVQSPDTGPQQAAMNMRSRRGQRQVATAARRPRVDRGARNMGDSGLRSGTLLLIVSCAVCQRSSLALSGLCVGTDVISFCFRFLSEEHDEKFSVCMQVWPKL